MPKPKREKTGVANRRKARRPRQRNAKNRKLLALILENPIKFETTNGRKITLIRQGFSNIYAGQEGVPGRALVMAFIDNKKIFFYRSSGETSKHTGQWFPTTGPEIINGSKGKWLGRLAKMSGHPWWKNNTLKNPVKISEVGKNMKRPYFPKAIGEIRKKIKKVESRLKLHEDWGLKQYLFLAKAFEKIPFTEEIRPE